MVSIGEHDHGDGEPCPGCRFKAVLAEHLNWANSHSEESWHDLTGELIVLMGTALSMLTAMRGAYINGIDSPESAEGAAAAISRLGGVIDETWHALMDDDGQADK